MSHVQDTYIRYVPKAPVDDTYPFAYNFVLVDTIEKLKETLKNDDNVMGFDTETTDLSPEEADLVGYSYCFDGKTCYYVPVNHVTGGLGEEALDLIYDKMCKTATVFMFNMRFDCRMMEYHGYTRIRKSIEESDKSQEDKEKLFNFIADRYVFKYDMSKVNTVDVQAIVYLVDTNVKYPSLKSSEEWYLGWKGDTFAETVGDAKNFYYLTPEEAYKYAATDALGTLLLGLKLQPYYKEAKTSGILDTQCLLPLMRYEEELTKIDVDKLREYSKYYDEKIKGCEQRVRDAAGKKIVEKKVRGKMTVLEEDYNLGSVKDKNEMFRKLNICTDKRTAKGDWSTSKGSIDNAIVLLEAKEKRTGKKDPTIGFLKDLQNYATFSKQKTSYVDNVIAECDNPLHRNRLRFSYKTCEVPSGRLAAGGDKKNSFFAGMNIQNITKPKMCNWFCEKEELAYQRYPDLKQALDISGTREETWLEIVDKEGNLQKCYFFRILNWVFSDHTFDIEGQREKIAEGYKQDLNIRSCFLPDDDYYWVSLDFNAEEIRIPALWSGEPAWSNAFETGGDVHKSTAIAIWGEENYSKTKRKMAKGANFGLLYGMTARNFAERFDMSMEEAQEFVDKFKAGLPTLFNWIHGIEKMAEKNGTVYTMYGRPRRVKFWFRPEASWSDVAFGKRTAVNTMVQGTGADILKLVMIDLFRQVYNNPAGTLTNYVRFKNTIHDEINYQIKKDQLRPICKKIMKIMNMQLPGWKFPMKTGLEIGNRWGQCIGFDFDTKTFEIGDVSYDYYEPEENHDKVEMHETENNEFESNFEINYD